MTTSEPQPDGGSVMWPTPKAQDAKHAAATEWELARAAQSRAGSFVWAHLHVAIAMRERGLWPPPPPLPEDGQPLTLFAVDSLASPSPAPAAASPRTTPGGFGQRWQRSFADYDPPTRSWRTFQGSLLAEWETYSETWPRAGMTRNGTAYQLPPSVPLTAGTASGSWPTPRACSAMAATVNPTAKFPNLETVVAWRMWPTPTARLGHRRGPQAKRYWDPARSNDLDDAVATGMWPTPTANRWDGLQSHGVNAITGQLNPTWVEWLMGYPPGWTDCAD